MKTAVSVPDALFRRAETAARRLKISRSKLYATALSDFLQRENARAVTRQLNKLYSRTPSKLDPAFHRAQVASLDEDAW